MKFRIESPPKSPVRKLLTGLIAIALIVPLLMFSAALLAIILMVGVIAGGVFWWKTRALRQQMRSFTPQESVMQETEEKGEIIEGEVIRVRTDAVQ